MFKAAYNYITGGNKKEAKTKEIKGIEETRDDLVFFSDGDDIITGYDQTPAEEIATMQKKQLNEPYKDIKTIRDKLTQQEETEKTTEESEAEEEQTPETEEETETETKIIVPKEDDKKKSLSVSDDKKYISMFTDGVFSILEQSKPLIEAITEIEESLDNINDENKRYQIIEYAAEVLSKATDKEGNKLFKDKEEAKTMLFNLSSFNKHRIKYKLPINVQKEIKEKQPITINPMLKRQIINHSINRNIYQY